MNIFYFSAEVEPFAKSGGLGDVLGALPKAVAKQKDNLTRLRTFGLLRFIVNSRTARLSLKK